MTGKKSFILYADLIHTLSKLPDDKAGQLFKLILDYVNDKDPEIEDLLLQIAFEPIKQQLKRDLVSWREYREKQSENGKLGGRPKKTQTQENPKNPSLISETQKSLNVTANVNATVTENVIVNDINKSSNEDTKIFINANNQVLTERFFSDENTEPRNEIMKMLSVSADDLKMWSGKFNSHLIIEAKKHQTLNEWRKHFASWLRIQIEKQTKNTQNGTGKQKPANRQHDYSQYKRPANITGTT